MRRGAARAGRGPEEGLLGEGVVVVEASAERADHLHEPDMFEKQINDTFCGNAKRLASAYQMMLRHVRMVCATKKVIQQESGMVWRTLGVNMTRQKTTLCAKVSG